MGYSDGETKESKIEKLENTSFQLKQIDMTLEEWFYEVLKYAEHGRVSELITEIEQNLNELWCILEEDDEEEDFKFYEISCSDGTDHIDILSDRYTYITCSNIVCASSKIIFCVFFGTDQ